MHPHMRAAARQLGNQLMNHQQPLRRIPPALHALSASTGERVRVRCRCPLRLPLRLDAAPLAHPMGEGSRVRAIGRGEGRPAHHSLGGDGGGEVSMSPSAPSSLDAAPLSAPGRGPG